MGKPYAYIEVDRLTAGKEPVEARLQHYREFYQHLGEDALKEQAARCMNCGVPFCHGYGCPLGNNVPEFNLLVYQGRWRDAVEVLHLTNNFPEITGRICPALCEAACVAGKQDDAVTIQQVELAVVEKAWQEGWILPMVPPVETGKSVAVVGSGPAGLAAAQQLRRAGHAVTVFEKSDRIGGILRYGIPDFKLEKELIDRRVNQMKAEGVKFETEVDVGRDLSSNFLQKKFDAVCLTGGSGVPRDLPVPGRDATGIHFAMDFLMQNNKRLAGDAIPAEEAILATDKKVVVIGGGDTGSDCVGTALRQGARSVAQLELLPRPPEARQDDNPWPTWPLILRTSSSHEEGGERDWCISTTQFVVKDGRVAGLQCVRVNWEADAETGRMQMTPVASSEFEIEADLVLLAMGFVHPVQSGLLETLGVDLDDRGNVRTDAAHHTSVEGVFAAGDMNTGAWLVVGAIAAGRRMAREADLYLMGETSLPDCPPPPKF